MELDHNDRAVAIERSFSSLYGIFNIIIPSVSLNIVMPKLVRCAIDISVINIIRNEKRYTK